MGIKEKVKVFSLEKSNLSHQLVVFIAFHEHFDVVQTVVVVLIMMETDCVKPYYIVMLRPVLAVDDLA